MLGVGEQFPAFSVKATTSIDSLDFPTITGESYPSKWKVYFFWPKDFSFVCPTEFSGFGDLNGEFAKRNAQLLGGSTDSEFVHHAWRRDHKDLRKLPFPMLADVKRELSSALGILHKNEGVCQRAVYIVDPDNVIRFVMVTDLGTGRNPAEVLRVLDALQTGGLTPCNWKAGEETLKV